jgi:sucrose-6-phosphate hydrolase SacC (GH32 family)
MKWTKHGLIYAPDGRLPWAKHYAFPPTPYFLGDGRLRLYCAFCDAHTVGRVGYVDVDPADPKRVLAVSERPVLDIGEPGCFDENGLLPTSVVPVGDKLYLYYVGYQLGMKVRYYQFQGLAVSEDGGATFRRRRRTPVLDRSDAEPHHRTSAFVMRDGGRFKAWYVGGDRWTEVNGKSLPVYSIKYLESDDGEHWGPTGEPCINLKSDDEHALGRAWVLKGDRLWRMFYSSRTRSKGYRLGYAESADGRRWTRKDDEVGIDVSPDGWDSQMIAYSSVVPYRDKVYLFYNGNNCGQTGFGYAVLEHW